MAPKKFGKYCFPYYKCFFGFKITSMIPLGASSCAREANFKAFWTVENYCVKIWNIPLYPFNWDRRMQLLQMWIYLDLQHCWIYWCKINAIIHLIDIQITLVIFASLEQFFICKTSLYYLGVFYKFQGKTYRSHCNKDETIANTTLCLSKNVSLKKHKPDLLQPNKYFRTVILVPNKGWAYLVS